MTRTLEGRSLPISILIHAAAVSALILTSILLPEPFPEATVGAASAPVAFPIEPRPRPVEVVVPGPRLGRPRGALAAPASNQAPPLANPVAQARVWPDSTEVPSSAIEVADFDGSAIGGCQGGCVVSNPDALGAVGSADGAGTTLVHRVGGDLRPPRKIRNVAPEYPEIARRIHVSGEVVVDCLIDERGRVREASVLRGHPLLAPAAVAAVERWVYEPSLLNGVPVQVLMTVTVRFALK
jgi:protein TonB